MTTFDFHMVILYPYIHVHIYIISLYQYTDTDKKHYYKSINISYGNYVYPMDKIEVYVN